VKRLVPLLLLLAGCTSSYDARSLADSVGRTYAHLYERSLQQAGNPAPEPVRVFAVCVRGGEDTPDRGPGDDWRCRVEHLRLNGPPPVTYEVTLKPDGCFTAEGPPAVVGGARVTDVDGVSRLNPLYAFDGCL
jgi:ABC-2 type transport system permease protein